MYEAIVKANPDLTIKELTAESFAKYGRILDPKPFAPIIDALQNVIPGTDEPCVYTADEPKLHFPESDDYLQNVCFGGMDFQIGYCCGHNNALNGWEYHQGNEVNIAATDCIVILSTLFEIKDGVIDSSSSDLFYVKAGTVLDLYATTLHYAPCKVGKDCFRWGVGLLKGTNGPFDRCEGMIAAKNKWLLVCPGTGDAEAGAYVGITGGNIFVNNAE